MKFRIHIDDSNSRIVLLLIWIYSTSHIYTGIRVMQVFFAINLKNIQTIVDSVCFHCLHLDLSYVDHSATCSVCYLQSNTISILSDCRICGSRKTIRVDSAMWKELSSHATQAPVWWGLCFIVTRKLVEYIKKECAYRRPVSDCWTTLFCCFSIWIILMRA